MKVTLGLVLCGLAACSTGTPAGSGDDAATPADAAARDDAPVAQHDGGVDVVFANLHEFSDGTGDVNACPGAALAGIQPWTDHQAQVDIAVWIAEQYLKIAVDHGADMIFMLEHFCGHGYKRDDPTGPCYRGPGQEMWLDATCIHPNAAGHAALADLFYSVIAE
ncbi:MAG: hypothetical protein HY906_15870 [Deltaproteobacteria bacterium]|nr:hypothetical protein [Deltaproteobacteria bacterium]